MVILANSADPDELPLSCLCCLTQYQYTGSQNENGEMATHMCIDNNISLLVLYFCIFLILQININKSKTLFISMFHSTRASL